MWNEMTPEEIKKYFEIYVERPRGKATLRLYLNDPAIQEKLRSGDLPVPIELRGEVSEAIRLGDRLTKHIVFSHNGGGSGLSPVFLDLDEPPKLRERLRLWFLTWLERILSKLGLVSYDVSL